MGDLTEQHKTTGERAHVRVCAHTATFTVIHTSHQKVRICTHPRIQRMRPHGIHEREIDIRHITLTTGITLVSLHSHSGRFARHSCSLLTLALPVPAYEVSQHPPHAPHSRIHDAHPVLRTAQLRMAEHPAVRKSRAEVHRVHDRQRRLGVDFPLGPATHLPRLGNGLVAERPVPLDGLGVQMLGEGDLVTCGVLPILVAIERPSLLLRLAGGEPVGQLDAEGRVGISWD
mmetsp:Transcript_11954/g.34656  ORF Transcript_11954/g.34656 Transcript_11954/m.34656 type:complete len:230 (+) Transcript_11954:13-702(+)